MAEDFNSVETDAMQKIHQVAPGTFIGQAGYVHVCDFQVRRARELAATDIRTLSAELAKASIPELERLVEALKAIRHLHPKISSALDGELSLHGTIIAGRNANGELGYAYHDYRVRGGRVVCETGEYFGTDGRLHTTSGPPAQAAVAADLGILAGEPIEIVRKLFSALTATCNNIGGPMQCIQLGGGMARWISPPPAQSAAAGRLQASDALFAGQATFASSGGGKVIINSSGVKIQNSITSPTSYIEITSSSVNIVNGAFAVSSGNVHVNIDQANFVRVLNSLTNTVYGCDGGSVFAIDNAITNAAATLSINNAGTTSSQGEVQVVHHNGTNVTLTPVISGSASAGSATLPSNPYGFIVVRISGTNYKVPYYAA
jgi:hypothetical protein